VFAVVLTGYLICQAILLLVDHGTVWYVEKIPLVETFQCLLNEAEYRISSRPLTLIPIDFTSSTLFLLGCPNHVQTPVAAKSLPEKAMAYSAADLLETMDPGVLTDSNPTS